MQCGAVPGHRNTRNKTRSTETRECPPIRTPVQRHPNTQLRLPEHVSCIVAYAPKLLSDADKDQEFVPHVHTDYSLLDGCSRVDRLCSSAAERMKALSITDHGVLYGLTSFFKQAEKHGIKPLLGCEIYLVYEEKLAEVNELRATKVPHGATRTHFQGYQNLLKSSRSHTKGHRNPVPTSKHWQNTARA